MNGANRLENRLGRRLSSYCSGWLGGCNEFRKPIVWQALRDRKFVASSAPAQFVCKEIGKNRSQRRPDRPRGEFFLADAVDLTLRLLAAGDRQNLFEYLPADNFHRRAFENDAGIDVHVVEHVMIKRRIGGDLD